MIQHLPQAARTLFRTPAFTAIVVVVLALGIGANTAIFSVVDAALLKPMPIPRPHQVVRISADHPQAFVWFNRRGFEVSPELMRITSFETVAAYVAGELTMAGRGSRVRAVAVTPEFFDVLGIPPIFGRAFNGGDITSGSFDLAVISHELWQSAFNGARDILGRKIVLNRQPFVVLGVMPRDFDLPQAAEVWVPSYWGDRVASGRWVFPIVVARLAGGVTPAQAVREIATTQSPGNARRTDHRWVEIVGVVRDVRLAGPAGRVEATAYVPFTQRQAGGPLQFVVKTHGNPAQLIAAARDAGMRIDPNVPLYDIRTFDQIREAHVRDRRFVMTMLSWFGMLAFVLAVLGLYAIVSYLVHLRTREIGIRMAMGATTGAVRSSVLANGMAHCVGGIVIGSVIAMGLSRGLSSQIRDLGQIDLITLSIVSAAFLASAALATWVPARRATRIDPVQALRFD